MNWAVFRYAQHFTLMMNKLDAVTGLPTVDSERTFNVTATDHHTSAAAAAARLRRSISTVLGGMRKNISGKHSPAG